MRASLRRASHGLALAAVTAAVVAPTSVLAASRYSDVPADPALEAAVEYLADSGITQGCSVSGPAQYCPDDAVTRRQMALFLHRMSGNGTVEPSVDAQTVQGFTPSQLRGQAGPPGPAGSAGAAGPRGDTGPAGAQGATGPAGAQGAAGATGATGPKGDTGAPGVKGDPGANGVSRAFSTRIDANTQDEVRLVLTLPAGSAYVVNTKAIVLADRASSSASTTLATCDLRTIDPQTGDTIASIDRSEVIVQGFGRDTIPTQATTPKTTQDTTVALVCTGVATFSRTVLTAIAVDALNPTS